MGNKVETAAPCPYCSANFEDSRLTLDVVDKIEAKSITKIIAEALKRPYGT